MYPEFCFNNVVIRGFLENQFEILNLINKDPSNICNFYATAKSQKSRKPKQNVMFIIHVRLQGYNYIIST
jgi:hypothetical protein